MPLLSPLRASAPTLQGLQLVHRGKVRDTYDLGNGLLLVFCTDGISIFDFVLNCLVPGKGMILTAMTHFWLMYLESFGIRTHFVAAGVDIDMHLPRHLRNDPILQSHAMVVRKLKMDNCEFIGRVALTGSILKEYLSTSTANGQQLPEDLQDGDLLPYHLDTPTTKADVGHDEPLDAADIRAKYPHQTNLLLQTLQIMHNHAKGRGIFLADTKEEMGLDEFGNLLLGDEVGTPDSSRFWDYAQWQRSRMDAVRRAPPPFDKQLVRQYGIQQGINDTKKYDPKDPADVARVHKLEIPRELVEATTQTYRYIFWRLVGMTVEEYLVKHLGVSLPRKKKRIDIVFGSESDISGVKGVLDGIGEDAEIHIHVISCHRNPEKLRLYAKEQMADVIIAAGGMAFALPGVLDALICEQGERIPVIGVALAPELEAAQLSISKLPGQPVVIDEINGCVYSGKQGLKEAIDRAVSGEMPPWKPRAHKPAKLNIDISTLT